METETPIFLVVLHQSLSRFFVADISFRIRIHSDSFMLSKSLRLLTDFYRDRIFRFVELNLKNYLQEILQHVSDQCKIPV